MEREKDVKKDVSAGKDGNVKPHENIDEQSAMHLTRSFWLAFNGINMYGEQHPRATRAVNAFNVQLRHLRTSINAFCFIWNRMDFSAELGVWTGTCEFFVSLKD